jgi:hypothetical protein
MNISARAVYAATKCYTADVIFQHLVWMQPLQQCLSLPIGHFTSQGESTKSLMSGHHDQMLLKYTQLECGTATLILEADFSRCEQTIMAKNWITECWKYLFLCESTATISGLWSPAKGREGDTALMDEFTIQDLTDKKMGDFNRCIMYLQAFYTSGIMDLAGKAI